MNSVNSFTMYFDYFNLIDTLPLKDKAALLIAINDYMFKDIEPNLSGHNQAIFNTLKNQLNVSKSNSKRRNRTTTEQQQNNNRTETETKPNEEPNKNKTSIFNFKFYIYNFKFIKNNNLLISKIEDWLNYKQQRKDKPYTEIGLKTLLKRIDKAVEEHGVENVINLIDECIANNYQGIIFDKLKTGQAYSNTNTPANQKWEETKREFMRND